MSKLGCFLKFDMKYLGAANFILGIEIKREWTNKRLQLGYMKYIETVLQRFNMQECKPIKLSVDQCPKTQEEVEDMSRVPMLVLLEV